MKMRIFVRDSSVVLSNVEVLEHSSWNEGIMSYSDTNLEKEAKGKIFLKSALFLNCIERT